MTRPRTLPAGSLPATFETRTHMPVILAALLAALIGALLAIGGSVALTASQGGGSFPEQNTGSITVYGNN